MRDNYTTPPSILIHTYSSSSCIRFVKEGLGFSLIPDMSIANDASLYTEIIRDRNGEQYTRPTRLLYHARALRYKAYKVFVDFFQERMKTVIVRQLPTPEK